MVVPSRRSLLRAIRQSSILLGVMLIGVVWSAVYVDDARRRAAETQAALKDAASFVRLFAQNTNSLIKELDRVALFVRDHVEREDGLARFHQLVAHARVLSDIAIQIAVAGPDGLVAATSVQPAPSTPVDLSDREHFQVHAAGGPDELFVSKAVLGRVSGRWSIQLTRRLANPGGGFGGVVVVSLSPEQLARFYSSLSVAADYTISIVGADGRVRASAGLAALPLDTDIGTSDLMRRARTSPADVFFDRAHRAGRASIVAYQTLPDFPLLVSVSLPEEARLGNARREALRYLAPAVLLTLVVLLAMFFSARRKLLLDRARAEIARSERRARHRARQLGQKRSELELTLEHMNHGIVMVGPDGKLRVINRKAAALLGLAADEARSNSPYGALLDALERSGELIGAGRKGGIPPLFEWERQNGTVLELRTNALPDGGFVRTISDITDRRRSEARILHLANHDPLTGLANRVLFHKKLASALERAETGRDFALLLLDLDGFKSVNDTLGHPFGDKLLAIVGERLRAAVRAEDVIARLGGDEFAILRGGVVAADECRELAGRVVEVLGAPFLIDGQHVVIGASLGIARVPADGANPDELMMAADMALYDAKAEGRGRFSFYRPELNQKVQERRQLEMELRFALERCQFELHYQPVSGAVTGFEALMRWPHPMRGMVPPASFIPVAEIGLIVPLGEWALREACVHAASWPQDVQVAINLSPLQFRSPTLRLAILKALEASGLPPHRLVLEITESTLLQQTEATLELLHDVRALGVTIAMDDFGTGYSSLSYLQRFPFDKVKIDRSFVATIGAETDSAPVLRAIVEVANALGMSTTAEGVETPEQLALLLALGCKEMQGYLFSAARPAAEVAAMLAQFSGSDRDAA